MAADKKAKKLIEAIQVSQTYEEALATLHLVLKELYLTNTYTDLVRIQDSIKAFQKRFKEITKGYTSDIIDVRVLNKLRTDLNFLYRDIVDELCANVNRMRTYYEEMKTVARADGMNELKDDKDLAEKFNVKSASAARDLLGNSETYRKYVTEASLAYSNYKVLDALLTSIRMTIDGIAGHVRYLGVVDAQKAQ